MKEHDVQRDHEVVVDKMKKKVLQLLLIKDLEVAVGQEIVLLKVMDADEEDLVVIIIILIIEHPMQKQEVYIYIYKFRTGRYAFIISS